MLQSALLPTNWERITAISLSLWDGTFNALRGKDDTPETICAIPWSLGIAHGQEIPVSHGGRVMNLGIWLPAMFLLGVVVMGLCYAFLIACENI
ncbi:MAG: hypothetical protein ABSC63_16755 [Candidatus Binataceae bacterium]